MKEVRTIVYDEQLKLEAYQFLGILQKFPNHFHDYYMIGFIESGRRRLYCNDQEYEVLPGDLLLFEPGRNHSCEQIDDEPLNQKSLSIPKSTMQEVIQEIYGCLDVQPPAFKNPLVHNAEQVLPLQKLHTMIMEQTSGLEKEELFYFLINEIIKKYSVLKKVDTDHDNIHMESICDYMKAHYAESISLEALSEICHMGKYSMLRKFTESKGITPYQYLISIRVNKAMDLLKAGMEPMEIALQTGFTDQSHFANTFKKSIGLTPGQYKMLREWEK